MRGAVTIELGGETVELLPDRALFWRRERTLFIADTHFGKASAFRAAGVPVPEGVTAADTLRLDTLIASAGAQRLVILGDFFHAPAGRVAVTDGCLASWRRTCASLDILLVRGNHDRGAGDPPPDWNIRCVEPGESLGPFVLTHTPDEAEHWLESREGHAKGYHALCGHVHPGVRLREQGGWGGGCLPCFLMRPQVGVLPTFGRLTRLGVVTPRGDDRVFVVADDEVLEVGGRAKVST